MEDQFTQQSQPSLRDLLLVVWRRKWFLPLCLGLIVGPVCFYILRIQRPVYESTAQLLLDVPTRTDTVFGESLTDDEFDIKTEFEVMKAEGVLTKAGQLLDLAHLDYSWLSLLTFDVVDDTRVMVISGQGPTPEVARDVTNATANAYVELRRQRRAEAASATLEWLREQGAEAKVKLLWAEEQFQRFKKAKSLPSLEQVRAADLQRYETLSDAYLQTQKLRLEAEAELRAAEEPGRGAPDARPLAAGGARPSTTLREEGGVLSTLGQLAATIRRKELELDAQSRILKQGHPKVKELKSEIAALRSHFETVSAQSRKIHLGMLRRRFDALRAEEKKTRVELDAWQSKMLTVSDVAVEYGILERQAQTARATYDLIDDKLRQLAMTSGAGEDTARLLRAATNGQRVDPRNPIKVAMALFAAVAVFLALCFLLEGLDTSIRTPEDVERYVGLPVVALIPTCREKQRARRRITHERPKTLPNAPQTTDVRVSGGGA